MSPLDAATMAAFPVEPLAARLYWRQCYVPAAPNQPDPLWINAAAPSRWQTPAGTLYLAETVETVMAEYCRNQAADVAAADPTGGFHLTPGNFAYFAPRPVGDPLPVRAVYSVDISLDRVVNFRDDRTQTVLTNAGIDPDDLLADDYGPCPDIAELGEQLGWQAVRAVSAADRDGTALAVFRAFHPPPNRWTLVDEAVRPSVLIAYLTRYKAGERPAWLAN